MRRTVIRAAAALALMLTTGAMSVVAVPTKLLSDSRPGFELE